MRSMKTTKSWAGICNGISIVTLLKYLLKKLLRPKPLTHIFNLSFSTGIIPHNLKIALYYSSIVTLISKGNEENKFENYRSISVLYVHVFQITRKTYN
jgi:hypothetical protein